MFGIVAQTCHHREDQRRHDCPAIGSFVVSHHPCFTNIYDSHLDIEDVELGARLAPHDAIVGDPLLLVEPRREPVRALRVRQVAGDDDRAGVHVRIQVSTEGLNEHSANSNLSNQTGRCVLFSQVNHYFVRVMSTN